MAKREIYLIRGYFERLLKRSDMKNCSSEISDVIRAIETLDDKVSPVENSITLPRKEREVCKICNLKVVPNE